MNISEVLNENGFGQFVTIKKDEIYKNDKYNAFVYDAPSFAKKAKQSLFEEIPYMENEFLKRHLPENLHNEAVLNDYKTLSSYDHSLLSNALVDEEIFLMEAMIKYTNLNRIDFMHPDSKIITHGDIKIVVSEI